MEKEYKPTQEVHMGRNVARFRNFRGMKQQTLAEQLGISQQTLSDYEQKKEIKPEILLQIAAILNIPREMLESFPDEATPNIIIENNTFEEGSVGNIAPYGQHEVKNENFGNTHHPITEMADLLKEVLRSNQEMMRIVDERLTRLEDMSDNNN